MPRYTSEEPRSTHPDAVERTSSIDATRTAVVVIDMINHQLTPGRCFLAAMDEAGTDVGYIVDRVEHTVVPNLQRLLTAARTSGCLIAYVRVGSADGTYGDTSTTVRAMMSAWDARDGAWACEVIDALRPAPTDLTMMKAGSSAFTATKLNAVLDGAAIENVVCVGVVTDGCVLLTAGAAFDLGYTNFVVSDCTATFSPELQSAAEQLIGNFMAQVITTDQFIESLM